MGQEQISGKGYRIVIVHREKKNNFFKKRNNFGLQKNLKYILQ